MPPIFSQFHLFCQKSKDQQVNAYRQTGALMSKAVLGVVEEARENLTMSEEAEELFSASLQKRVVEQSAKEKQRQRRVLHNSRYFPPNPRHRGFFLPKYA